MGTPPDRGPQEDRDPPEDGGPQEDGPIPATARRLIVALDVATLEEARALICALDGVISFYKIGMELIYAGGLDLARELVAAGQRVFLDAKLLDIGHTVERATASIARLGVDMLTIHGTDRKTLDAAVRGRGNANLRLLAVTVMTSLTSDDLAEQGVSQCLSPAELVLRRARMAKEAGFDGVIASAREARSLRAELGPDRLVITPGIRLKGGEKGDQARVMTPADALAAGADYLVVGRPVLKAPDPRQAALAIARDMS